MKGDVGEIKQGLAQLRSAVEPSRSRGGLPGGTPKFVGRHDALDELAGQVKAHDPAGIVVAIHAVDGMAGVGKTELALVFSCSHLQEVLNVDIGRRFVLLSFLYGEPETSGH